MSTKKYSAGRIFTGTQMLENGSVLIIDADGRVLDLVKSADAGDDILHLEGTLSPGFINCHCHLELSHLKELIPEHSGLPAFVRGVMQQREAHKEFLFEAMVAAEAAMYQSGIVAVGDICNGADSIGVKKESKLHWHSFLEVTGFVPGAAQKRFDATLALAKQFTDAGLVHSIVPHAPYSVSKPLFALIDELPQNSIISIHNQESNDENDLYRNKTGAWLELYKELEIDIDYFKPVQTRSLPYWLSCNTHAHQVISVHNRVSDGSDITFIREWMQVNPAEFFFCLCPRANQYISESLPDINLLFTSGIPVVLGTDSLASNYTLNLLEEMKCIRNKFAQIEWTDLLCCATYFGARALKMDRELGSFEKGKKPGIVLIDPLYQSSKRIA